MLHQSQWSGREDGPGPDFARWHNVLSPAPASPVAHPGGAVTLVGFASDEGVRRNEGRSGTSTGPAAIRKALGNVAVHSDIPRFDAGTISVDDHDLESGLSLLSDVVAAHVATSCVVVLGGGGEISYGSHRGMRRALSGTIGIINIDAHFDLRPGPSNSGTSFAQIHELGGVFDYTVFGIAPTANIRHQFNEAERLGVDYYLDDQVRSTAPEILAAQVHEIADRVDHLHLVVDLDALPASVAPGVSAPAAYGVHLHRVRALVTAAAATGKLRLVDIAELNPSFDLDGRTAKVAARLIDEVTGVLESSPLHTPTGS